MLSSVNIKFKVEMLTYEIGSRLNYQILIRVLVKLNPLIPQNTLSEAW